MKINFIPTKEDFYESQKLNYYSSKQQIIAPLCGLFVIIFVLFIGSGGLADLFFSFVGLTLFVYQYTWLRVYSHFAFKKAVNLHSEISYDIEEKGIHCQTRTSNGEIKWDTYIKARHNEKILIYYITNRLMNIIPRKSVSDQDWQGLIDLTKKNIKDFK